MGLFNPVVEMFTLKIRYLPLLSLPLALPKPTFAAINTVETPGGFAPLSELVTVFANLSAAIATLAGFAVLIMLIRGGIAYITAQGDPKALASARSTITWALIGFVVILAAFATVSLIAGFVQIPGLGRFCLPTAGQEIGRCVR